MFDLIRRRLRRRNAYRTIFLDDKGELSPEARIVMADLTRFCRATTTSLHVDNQGRIDPGMTFVCEGRREVVNRILNYLHLPERIVRSLPGEDINDDDTGG